MIRVCSHPRSGTNFLMDIIARNFYDYDTTIKKIDTRMAGHWLRRVIECQPYYIDGKLKEKISFHSPFAELWASHAFNPPNINIDYMIYIIRDGRDVALSCWRWKGSMREEMENLSFSEYIRSKLDWIGSFGMPNRGKFNFTIFEHWMNHVINWVKSGIYVVRYESLLINPRGVVEGIARHFDLEWDGSVNLPNGPVGWAPTGIHKISKWKEEMCKEDLDFFDSIVPSDFIGRWK